MPVPAITDYMSIARAVIISGLTRAEIVALVDDSTIASSDVVVSGRTMIQKASFNTWYDDYVLAQRSFADVLTDGADLAAGTTEYLEATFKQVGAVEFTDIDDPARVLADESEFMTVVGDTATGLA
jgi:hypothetical protein